MTFKMHAPPISVGARAVGSLTRADRALAESATAMAKRCGAHSVRYSFGVHGVLDAVIYHKPPEYTATRSTCARPYVVQPEKLTRRERQLQDLVCKFLVRGGAHSVRFAYGARGNFQAVLLFQLPRLDEKLHNTPATSAIDVPAKAARDEMLTAAEQAPTARPASPAATAPRPASPAREFKVLKLKVSMTIDKNSLSARGGAGTDNCDLLGDMHGMPGGGRADGGSTWEPTLRPPLPTPPTGGGAAPGLPAQPEVSVQPAQPAESPIDPSSMVRSGKSAQESEDVDMVSMPPGGDSHSEKPPGSRRKKKTSKEEPRFNPRMSKKALRCYKAHSEKWKAYFKEHPLG